LIILITNKNKKNLEEAKKYVYLSSLSFFKEYIKNNYVHKKIVQLKKEDKRFDISIFPNGRLYDLNGEDINEEESYKIWDILYQMGKDGKLGAF